MSTCQAVSSSPVATVAVVLTAMGALVFVIAYAASTRGAWRDNMVGVNVMVFMGSIAAVSALAVAGIVWGTDWPHREVVRTLAWGSIGVCIWWRVFLLFKVQRRRAAAKSGGGTTP